MFNKVFNEVLAEILNKMSVEMISEVFHEMFKNVLIESDGRLSGAVLDLDKPCRSLLTVWVTLIGRLAPLTSIT